MTVGLIGGLIPISIFIRFSSSFRACSAAIDNALWKCLLYMPQFVLHGTQIEDTRRLHEQEGKREEIS